MTSFTAARIPRAPASALLVVAFGLAVALDSAIAAIAHASGASHAFQPLQFPSYTMLTAIGMVAALRPGARIWAFKVPTIAPNPVAGTTFPTPDPSGSGYAAAVAWQRGQNCRLTLPGAPTGAMTVDLDVATTADPGAPV